VALMNTYYHALMANTPEQKPWADATAVFYPDQAGKGAFIMRSAIGMTKAEGNRDLAR
jgi:iron(III) transport system substrate-binding protein